MTPEQLERAVQKITELLDAAFGNFMPACGGDFADYAPSSPCHQCESFQQCKHNSHLAEINAELQKLVNERHGRLTEPPDAREDPKNATAEELREAAIWFYCKDFKESFDQEQVAYLIRLGWNLAQPGGCNHIHPYWLKKSQNKGEIRQ